MRVDLHVHTNASDGQYSPSEVVALARDFDIIAITDHDTTDGVETARAAAAQQGMPTIIAGIEISTAEDRGDVHMLGYYVDLDDADFQTALTDFRNARFRRGQQMVEKLTSLGMPLDWVHVQEIAGGSVGRPHVARAMVEAGYVESVKEAFQRYIGNDGPAYVARKRLTPEESVELIHQAGGVAVFAHPGLVPQWRETLASLLRVELDGVEVNHPSNDEPMRLELRAVAVQHNLIMTGGSDFHGPKVKPGNALGCVTPPDGAVHALQTRAKRYAKA